VTLPISYQDTDAIIHDAGTTLFCCGIRRHQIRWGSLLNMGESPIDKAVECQNAEGPFALLEAFRDTLQHAPIVLLAIDRSGIFQLVEGGGLRFWQTATPPRVGGSMYDLLEDSPDILDGFEKALAGQSQLCRTYLGERIFEIDFSPSPANPGQRVRASCIAQDVTERMESDRQHIQQQLAAFEQERQMAAGLRVLIENLPLGIVVTRNDQIVFHNLAACTSLRWSGEDAFLGEAFSDLVPPASREWVATQPDGTAPLVHFGEMQVTTGDGKRISAEIHSVGIEFDGLPARLLSIRDVTDLHRMEQDLRQAQRLESIGRLAAGIAHEINTPIQFIGDNSHFLKQGFADVMSYLAACLKLLGQPEFEAHQLTLAKLREDFDIGFVEEESPKALERITDGVARVAKIVAAMKSFAHPGSAEKNLSDLNRALETTIVVATNEIKGVAEVVTEFGDVPHVPCLLGEMNQVFLNLLVNAAHAIESRTNRDSLGRIGVRTFVENDHVVVEISDNGSGIPPEIRDRVYDPFFTTKEVGRGTGQGLAIAHRTVVEQHHGLIDFTTEVGKGTSFFIRLPLSA
jgi:PAS domain S-box-containing protein